jgi:hypothetical protein
MCLNKGVLRTKLITKNSPSFDLDGMINPTFTNVGTSSVNIDEELIATGESFKIDAPGILLSGNIAINFLSSDPSQRMLVLRYVTPV